MLKVSIYYSVGEDGERAYSCRASVGEALTFTGSGDTEQKAIVSAIQRVETYQTYLTALKSRLVRLTNSSS